MAEGTYQDPIVIKARMLQIWAAADVVWPASLQMEMQSALYDAVVDVEPGKWFVFSFDKNATRYVHLIENDAHYVQGASADAKKIYIRSVKESMNDVEWWRKPGKAIDDIKSGWARFKSNFDINLPDPSE